MDLRTISDTDLDTLLEDVRAEIARRYTISQAEAQFRHLSEQYLGAEGISPGDEYRHPTGYHDAYPMGWLVTCYGKTWRALRDGATGTPGESHDWQEIVPEGLIPAWSQPQAGGEYQAGDQVTHAGRIWESERVTGHEPGVPHSGWEDLGPADTGEVPE